MNWLFFFFKQKTAYEMRISDWSSDVCSSDLLDEARAELLQCRREALAGTPRTPGLAEGMERRQLRDADEAGCDAVILEREQRVVPRQRADDAEQPPEMDQRPQHGDASERRRPGRLVLHRARRRPPPTPPAGHALASTPPG